MLVTCDQSSPVTCDQSPLFSRHAVYSTAGFRLVQSRDKAGAQYIVRLIRTISLHFIVESQTWYQNDRGVMLISNQSDAKIIGLGSRVIIGLNWP